MNKGHLFLGVVFIYQIRKKKWVMTIGFYIYYIVNLLRSAFAQEKY